MDVTKSPMIGLLFILCILIGLSPEASLAVMDNIYLPGGVPQEMDVNPNTHRIYVVGLNHNLVVIDSSNGQILDNIYFSIRGPRIEEPGETHRNGHGYSVAVNPKTNRVYAEVVTSSLDGTCWIRVYDGSTLEVIRSLNVCGKLVGDWENDKLYAIWPDGISEIDTRSDVVTSTISTTPLQLNVSTVMPSICCAVAADVDPVGKKVFFSISDSLYEINESTRQVSKTMTYSDCSAMNPSLEYQKCSIRAIAVNPSLGRIYLAVMPFSTSPTIPINGSLNVLDVQTFESITNKTLSFSAGLAVDPHKERIYASHLWENKLTTLDEKSYSVINSTQTGFYPYGVAIDPMNSKIFTLNTCYQRGCGQSLSMIDDLPSSVTIAQSGGNYLFFLIPAVSIAAVVGIIGTVYLRKMRSRKSGSHSN